MGFTGKATYSAGATLPELAEDVSDIIGIVSPHETPLLDHLGDPKREAMSTVHEWLEDSLASNIAVVAQSAFDPGPTTDTTLVLADVSFVRVGDLLRVRSASEVMLVTAVDTGTDTVTVVRGYGATTAATLSIGTTLLILGNAALEGDDAPSARFSNRVRRQNYTQIFTQRVSVSGSLQASRAYGIEDEVDYQKQERLRELLRDMENTVINGVSAVSNPQGGAGVRRTMRGLLPSIATNVFEPGAGGIPDGDGAGENGLNEEVLNAALRAIWEQSSGVVDTIVVGGAQKRRINQFVSTERSYLPEDASFRDLISVYESDFGVARIVLSRWMPGDKVLLLDSSRVDVMPLRGRSFFYKPLAATGDSVEGQMIGEYTLEMRNENAHGVIGGLAV